MAKVAQMVAAPKKSESLWDKFVGLFTNNNNKVINAQGTYAKKKLNELGYRQETIGDRINQAVTNTQPASRIGNYISNNAPSSSSEPVYQPVANQYTSGDVSGGYAGGYGGGYAGIDIDSIMEALKPQKVDLTDILASYEQGASAQKQTITDSQASQRQSLLDSLKRFQQETSDARAQQAKAYTAGRADLEGQAFMANRQAAQNAAARGLGGSGLQQLAQIQNLVNQSNATNTLAQSNVDVLKAIAQAAQNKEEDTNTAISNLEKEAANKIAEIDANNAQAKANLQYKEAVRYEEARQEAEQFRAQLEAANRQAAASYSSYAASAAQELANAQETTGNMLNTALQQGMAAIKSARNSLDYSGKNKSKAIQKAYTNAQNTLYGILADTGLNFDLNPYLSQLENSYNTYYNSNNKY